MSYIFYDITSDHKTRLKNNTKVNLEGIYTRKWSEAVFNNSACINYRAMSLVKKTQNYILKLPKRYTYALCKLKCVNHNMPNVTGRYTNTPYEDRICTFCKTMELEMSFTTCLYVRNLPLKEVDILKVIIIILPIYTN